MFSKPVYFAPKPLVILKLVRERGTVHISEWCEMTGLQQHREWSG